MASLPDRFYVEKNDKEIYDAAMGEIFGQLTRKEQFLVAVVYGCNNSAKKGFTAKENFFLEKDMDPEDWAFLKAVIVGMEGPETLLDIEKLMKISEEYAHGGLLLLNKRIRESPHGSPSIQIEAEILGLIP